MSENPEPQPQPKPHLLTWVAVVAAALLVLYVLSIGPAYGVWRRHGAFTVGKTQWYWTLYGPIEAAAGATNCRDWLWDYKDWWLKQMDTP